MLKGTDMNTTPDQLSAADEAMLWLNEVEKMQGGANGPTIKLRAAIAALGLPVSAAIEAFEPSQDCAPVAWLTTSGRQCLGQGDGPVRAVPATDEDCDFTVPLYAGETLAEVSRVARALALEKAELRNEALRVLVAWDGTVLPKSHDTVLQERMESLRATLG